MTPSEIRQAASDLIEDLVEIRLNRGITQASIAKAIGTSASAVNCIEHHKREPGLSVLLRYASAVGAELTFTTTRRN